MGIDVVMNSIIRTASLLGIEAGPSVFIFGVTYGRFIII